MKKNITIFHNPRCSKSRDALSLLKENGQTPVIIEYLKESPDADTIRQLLKLLGIQAIDLIRKNEVLFKEKFKNKEYTEEQWIDVMVKHPELIERPVVIAGKKAVIGRPPEKVLDLL